MNIIFATSNLYSQLALVTIKSLLINNSAEEINIFYIGNNITDINKHNIKELVDSYKKNVIFIDMPAELYPIKGLLRKDAIVYTYCYLQNIIPSNVEKALLIESDVIITGDIRGLYDLNIDDYYLAAADDMQSRWYKRKLGLNDDEPYFNSGILLVNLKKWRENNVTDGITEIIANGNHKFFYEVQDEMNTYFRGKVSIFPPKYNCTTALFVFDYKHMLHYRRPTTYCSYEEFMEARENPVIVHFTTNQIIQARPWIENCTHPYDEYYKKIKNETVNKDMKLWKDNRGKASKVVGFIYKGISPNIVADVVGIVHAFLYPTILYKFLMRKKT